MNDFIRYRSIGCTFFSLKQVDFDDLLDMEWCTWTQTQLDSDLLNHVLPVGLLIMDTESKELFKVVCTRTAHGHKHTAESVTKEIYGNELAQESI